MWVLTESGDSREFQKSLRYVDVSVPFQEALLNGSLFGDEGIPIAYANALLSDYKFLLRHCGEFREIQQGRTLQDQNVASYDFLIIEKKQDAVESKAQPGGQSLSSSSWSSSREIKPIPRSRSRVWESTRLYDQRHQNREETVLFESPSSGSCPMQGQAVAGLARSPIPSLDPPRSGGKSPRNSTSDGQVLRAASVEDLIVHLTTKKTYVNDPRFADIVFSQLLYMMPSAGLFVQLLRERFQTPPFLDEEEQREIKSTVVSVTRYWIKFYYHATGLAAYKDDVEKLIDDFEKYPTLYHGSIRSDLISSDSQRADPLTEFSTSFLTRQLPQELVESHVPSISRVFLDVLKVDDVCRQLTWVCAKLVNGARITHLLDIDAWTKASANAGAALAGAKVENAVVSLTHLFNYVADWVSAAILCASTITLRVRLLRKFLRLLRSLKRIQNFHLVMAVISGLSESSVSRLKWTWAKISTKERETLTKCEALMDFKGSWKAYRMKIGELRVASKDFIPAFAIASHDLTFIEEGNSSTVTAESISRDSKDAAESMLELPQRRPELINFSKYRQIYSVICSSLPQCDPLRPDPLKEIYHSLPCDEATQAFIMQLPQLPGERLYELSLIREPRNSSRADIK